MIYSVKHCSRCGADHDDLDFGLLTRPLVLRGETYTHWADCPDLMEPIIMRIVPGVAGVSKPAPQPGDEGWHPLSGRRQDESRLLDAVRTIKARREAHVMSPDERAIHDWIGALVPQDLGLVNIRPGILSGIQQAIETGKYRVPKTCAHCAKVIDGKVARYGMERVPVHEGCRTEVFEKRATLGQPGTRDDRETNDVLSQPERLELVRDAYQPEDETTS